MIKDMKIGQTKTTAAKVEVRKAIKEFCKQKYSKKVYKPSNPCKIYTNQSKKGPSYKVYISSKEGMGRGINYDKKAQNAMAKYLIKETGNKDITVERGSNGQGTVPAFVVRTYKV